MGMTFPFVASGLIRLREDSGKSSLSLLYFVNSLGGALGIVVTSYFFIRLWGTPGTSSVVGMGNLLLGALFLALSQHVGEDAASPIEEQGAGKDTGNLKFIKLFLFISLVTGFTSFVNEVSWIRLLSLALGSATHSFDVMVSAFIFGLASGALASRWLLLKYFREAKGVLIFAQVAMGLCALLTIFGYSIYFSMTEWGHVIFQKTNEGFVVYGIYKYLIALVAMFPMAFFAGMTLPVITYYVVKETGSEKYIGYVYGFNALGCILGTIAAGLVLLPHLELKGSIALGGLLDLGLGWALLFFFGVNQRIRRLTIISSGVVAVILLMQPWDNKILTSGVFRYTGSEQHTGDQMELSVRHGRTATVSFEEFENFSRIGTNGKTDGSVPKPAGLQQGQLYDPRLWRC